MDVSRSTVALVKKKSPHNEGSIHNQSDIKLLKGTGARRHVIAGEANLSCCKECA